MEKTSKLTDFEKKWGKACKKCGKRKYGFSASKKSEGGRSSTCQCGE